MQAGGPPKSRGGRGEAARNIPRRGDVIVERLEQLANISDEQGRLTRLYLGPAHKRAVDIVTAWMSNAGMVTRMDALGTVIGRYEGDATGLRHSTRCRPMPRMWPRSRQSVGRRA